VLAALAGASTILFSHTRARQEAAYNALLDAARSGRLPEEKIDFALTKVLAMKERFALADARPALDRVCHPDHVAITAKAARAAVVLGHNDHHTLPISAAEFRSVALVEFASPLDSAALESGGQTGFAALLARALRDVQSIALHPITPGEDQIRQAEALAVQSDVLIVATRSAHLYPKQQETAQKLILSGRRTILLCLRNPYDGGVLAGQGTTLFTCGDSAPSLQAAVDALLGRFAPAGRLPVPLTMPTAVCVQRGGKRTS
jgi:beta-N-acetylhexosaminidase